MISFQATGETDMYSISGLDSSQEPFSIAWEIVGGMYVWFNWFSWYKIWTKKD